MNDTGRIMKDAFADIDHWVFDLDNTLYPAACDLFAQIDVRMTNFVMSYLDLGHDEARALQKKYYAEYGTTLSGLMKLHDMNPKVFLEYVHDLDHSPLDKAPKLRNELEQLPGKKYIYTNGSNGHAEKVARYMGIRDLFADVVCISRSNFIPKHEPDAYTNFIELTGVPPHRATMFEDLSRNLEPAHALGMTTVLVTSDKDWSHEPEEARPSATTQSTPDHVDFTTNDLPRFLKAIHQA